MPPERIKSRTSLERLFWRQDREVPPALNYDDREALRIVIRIALESDKTFRRLLRGNGRIKPNSETDYLCGTIRAGIDFFAIVIQTCGVIRDVTLPRTTGTVRKILAEHGRQLRRLGRPDLTFAERLSTLLALIHIETVFWGQFWVLGEGTAPRRP
jgi:hypothetical protein